MKMIVRKTEYYRFMNKKFIKPKEEVKMKMRYTQAVVRAADFYKKAGMTEEQIANSQAVKDMAKRWKRKATKIAADIMFVNTPRKK